MTYNVFGGTLNLAQSIKLLMTMVCCWTYETLAQWLYDSLGCKDCYEVFMFVCITCEQVWTETCGVRYEASEGKAQRERWHGSIYWRNFVSDCVSSVLLA